MTSNVPTQSESIYHINRTHVEYDISGNATHIYETDDGHAIDGGYCIVKKSAYNASDLKTGTVRFEGLYWQAAWNLAKEI